MLKQRILVMVKSLALGGLFCLMFIAVAPISAAADDEENAPFNARNLNPFILIHGLPSAIPAALLAEGSSSLQFHLDVANHAKASVKAFESIRLDGETYRAAIIWKRGLGEGWQVGVELPLVSHGSGVMDQLILGQFGRSSADTAYEP